MGIPLEALNFDDPTPEESEMHQRMAMDLDLESTYAKQIDWQCHPKYEEYQGFLDAIDADKIDIEDIFGSPQAKINSLKTYMGYTALNGRNGRKVRLEDAKYSRVGKVTQRVYNMIRKERGF